MIAEIGYKTLYLGDNISSIKMILEAGKANYEEFEIPVGIAISKTYAESDKKAWFDSKYILDSNSYYRYISSVNGRKSFGFREPLGYYLPKEDRSRPIFGAKIKVINLYANAKTKRNDWLVQLQFNGNGSLYEIIVLNTKEKTDIVHAALLEKYKDLEYRNENYTNIYENKKYLIEYSTEDNCIRYLDKETQSIYFDELYNKCGDAEVLATLYMKYIMLLNIGESIIFAKDAISNIKGYVLTEKEEAIDIRNGDSGPPYLIVNIAEDLLPNYYASRWYDRAFSTSEKLLGNVKILRVKCSFLDKNSILAAMINKNGNVFEYAIKVENVFPLNGVALKGVMENIFGEPKAIIFSGSTILRYFKDEITIDYSEWYNIIRVYSNSLRNDWISESISEIKENIANNVSNAKTTF